jgi:hypothetical protein
VAGISAGLSLSAAPAAGEASLDAIQAGAPVRYASSGAAAPGHAGPRKTPASQPIRPPSVLRSSQRPPHKAAAVGARPGHPVARAHAVARARQAQSYLIYDSVSPAAIPAHHVIATYADGPHPVPHSEVAGRGPVLWIDVDGTDPAAPVLDVEPGCATPAVAASWVVRRLTAEPHAVAIIYTMISEWPAVQAAVGTLQSPMRSRIRWWIADPTGYPHLVPGSDATQWYWGSSYDISTATPHF